MLTIGNRECARALLAGVLVAVCAGRALAFGGELDPSQIYESSLPWVMTIEVEARNGTRQVGSAFLALQAGMAVTSWHLVSQARRVTARFSDHTVCDVVGLVDRDEVKDIALVSVDVRGRPAGRLCAVVPRVGTRAYAIGAPRGYEFSLSDGLVSQVRVMDGFSQYQVSCPISPGNSGGPILNASGDVLGVVAWSAKDAQNLNFATPASYVLSLNSTLPVRAWGELLKRARRGGPASACGGDKDSLVQRAPAEGLPELRRLLKSATGKRVTIRVDTDTGERAFSLTVPADLLR